MPKPFAVVVLRVVERAFKGFCIQLYPSVAPIILSLDFSLSDDGDSDSGTATTLVIQE
jgi:hypothetical protein